MSETDNRWRRIKQLFAQALEQPADLQSAWLEQASADDKVALAEVRSLLAARAQGGASSLVRGAARLAASLLEGQDVHTPAELHRGDQVGAYRLLSVLGEGGMGRVFLAERSDQQFRQQVALKSIRAEFATRELRERFLQEREILARLTHPNIAQLHDGGLDSNGAPYFTLELVTGEPIVRWCDEHRFDVRGRVALLLKVCDAVQYAHRNLIVHRDLKPSNVLVTSDGEPKLLDFGIAKLLEPGESSHLTATASRPMTREYAAPEQVLGEPITTATDVYGLGIMLYELLCGRLPYAAAEQGRTSWPKAIVEEDPEPLHRALTRPGAAPDSHIQAMARATTLPVLRRSLHGDLERIVQRALEKAPENRYLSVTALNSDLRAWLDGRALPGGSTRYQLGKFVRRNRVAVAFAAALTTVVIASLIVITVQSRYVAAEAQAALEQGRTTAAVKDFLLGLFRKADPNVAKGKEITARELVDRGAQRLDRIPADQIALKSELQTTLGTIYFQLGLYKPAAVLHAQAFAALKSLDAAPNLVAASERDLATELFHLKQLPKARTLADDALERLRAMPNAPAADLVRALQTVGWIAESERNGARAARVADEALAIARMPPVDDHLLAKAWNLEGSAHWLLHENEAAAQSYRAALSLDTKIAGPDDQTVLMDTDGIATALYADGRYAEAVGYFRKSRDAHARIFGTATLGTLHATEGLALVEHEAGLYTDARRDFEAILATLKSHPLQGAEFQDEVMLNFGVLLADSGDLDAAERNITTARDEFGKIYGTTFAGVTEAVSDLGFVHATQARLPLAEEELRQALAARAASHDNDVSMDLAHLSDVLRLRGDIDNAVKLGRSASDNALSVYGERSRQAARAHYYYGLALASAHRNNEAQAQMRASLHSFTLIVPPDGMHPFSSGPRLALGTMLAAESGHSAEAVLLLRQALKLRTDTFGSDHQLTVEARNALAKAQAGH